MTGKWEISITGCESYDPVRVREALSQVTLDVGGLDFVKPGMKIALKANLVTAAAPEKALVTHPEVLRALCDLLTTRGATVVIGDSPSGSFQEAYLNHVYKLSEMENLVREGVSLNHNFKQIPASYPEAKVLKTLTYAAWLADCDAIICVCKLKTHGMMKLSANTKNMFGAIPGTMKLEYHYRFPDHEDFADMLVDINEFLKPVLYVTDAVLAMEGNGPTAGTPRKIGALMAGRNPYALDYMCAEIIGLDPMDVPTVKAAWERGLYERPDSAAYLAWMQKDFKNPHPKDIEFGGYLPKPLIPIIRSAMQSRPQVRKRECIGCRKCQQICPAKAIHMEKGKPVIDRNQCIRCFCCQEFCPKGAMKVQRPMAARVLARL